jgi:hypothetical protein
VGLASSHYLPFLTLGEADGVPQINFFIAQVLNGLRLLGLQTSLGRETLLEAADALDQLRTVDSTSRARGHALLAQLDYLAQHGTPSDDSGVMYVVWKATVNLLGGNINVYSPVLAKVRFSVGLN